MLGGHYLNEDWQEVPIFSVPNDYRIHCERHGDFDPHAYYTDSQIAKDLIEQGYLDCPECLREICDE